MAERTPHDPRGVLEEGINLNSAPIEIIVGPGETKYYVHENIIRPRSAFFDAALSKAWKESSERVIRLPKENPEVFYAYLQHIYTTRITIRKDIEGSRYCRLLADMYVLGEKLTDAKFQDRVLDTMLAPTRGNEWEGRSPDDEAIDIIHRSTPVDSHDRRMVLDLLDLFVEHRKLAEREDELAERQHEVVRRHEALDERQGEQVRRYKALLDGRPCAYHKHKKDEPCCGTTS